MVCYAEGIGVGVEDAVFVDGEEGAFGGGDELAF